MSMACTRHAASARRGHRCPNRPAGEGAEVTLLDAAESIKALTDYLGHSDPGFTLRTHTHLMPQSEAHTRQAINGAFTRPRTTCSAKADQPCMCTECALAA